MYKRLNLIILGIFGITSLFATNLPDKHPLDETEYDRFVMENGLRVLLVSDPKLDKASASMCVGVGSLMNPEERQGLAHFLEHMLFLGTEKYPDADEYGNYLQSNGGYSNAYTSGDHTNYHFEVYPFAFEGALDRFAQFFIAPLFSQEYTDREKNAVHSEHQKNLENDSWRTYQLWRNHYNPGHPANMFSTGNLETLGDIQSEEFINFYREHYSANRMTLSLVAPNSLAEMKGWADEYFATIKNQHTERVVFRTDYILPSENFRLIKINPIKDIRRLSIELPMPSYLDKFDSKSAELINFILGYEGKGSLLSALKAKDWATGLGSSMGLDTMDYASLFVQVELTPNGLNHHREIIEYIYAYIELMKNSPFPADIFQERKTMARLEELYSDKGEGTGRAVALANAMMRYPLEVAERVGYLWNQPDEELYFELLNHVKPEFMMASLTAKELETDQVEAIYGTPYSYFEGDPDFIQSLKTPIQVDSFLIPEKNPFVPEEVKLLSERPVKIIDEPGLILYYSQDQEFLRPKVAIRFKIRHPESFISLENTVLKELYADCINEALNELAYPARMAGLGYSVSAGIEGLYITLSGYNESAFELLNEVMREMQEFNLSEARFEALKDAKVRSLKNFPKSDAWRITREAKRGILNEVYYSPAQKLATVEQMSIDDVRAFIGILFKKGYVEALVHGNVSRDEAETAARGIVDTLGMKTLKKDKVFENSTLVLDEGQQAFQIVDLEVNNSAYWGEYVLGLDNPENRAAALILNNYISEPYYSEMRTQQQLGYIVSGFASREDIQYALYFVIQSGQYPANVLKERSETFIATLPGQFAEISEQEFEKLREAAIALVEEKPKSIAEKAGGFYEKIYDLDMDLERMAESIEALKAIDHETVVEVLKNTLDPESASTRVTLGFGREHEKNTEGLPEPIAESVAWKSEQEYR